MAQAGQMSEDLKREILTKHAHESGKGLDEPVLQDII
jgi:hypothetical protein